MKVSLEEQEGWKRGCEGRLAVDHPGSRRASRGWLIPLPAAAIGITLVRRLVQMHGGNVQANSAGRGCGSEFVVRLSRTTTPSRSEEAGRETLSPPHQRRVLIVDDNRDAAQTLADLVELWGRSVRVVHDGPSALEQVLTETRDVVVLDFGLPQMDGYEVARRLRGLPLTPQPVLVVRTGYGQEEARRRA
jgi:CheY-like chemotaxis protein